MASNASMIRSLVVQRVDVSFPHSVPLQWSQNRQLAVNNGTQLTILDPKLPSLHQGINLVNNVTILNPRDIYHVTSILHSEVLGTLPIRNFGRVIVETGDEPFQFTNINEPDIVSHRWAGIDEYTRDCDLGVLFNTGEMVVLRRENSMIDKYVVVVNVFAELSAHYGVEIEKEDILVDSEQLRKIKVKNFEFSEFFFDSGEKKQLLSIINDNGDILIYELLAGSLGPKFLLEINTHFNIIKQCWSDWTKLGDSLYSAYVSVVNSDNSAYVYAVVYNLDSNTISSSPGKVLAPVSRFLRGQVKWVTAEGLSVFISTSTGRLQLTTVQTNSLVHKLHNYATSTGIITQMEGNHLSITISFENGKFEKYILDTTAFTLNDGAPSAALTGFVSKSLYSFQLINSTAEDPGVEGVFINYGTSTVGGNIATIAFKIVPKDVLHYKIVSQSEIQIAFIKLDNVTHDEHTLSDSSTSIAKMNDIWFQHFVDIPLFGLHSENRKERLHTYLQQIDVFRHKYFVKIENFMSEISSVLASSKEGLQASLSANFNLSPMVKQLQLRYNFEKQLFNFLIALEDDDELLKKTVDQTISDIGHIEKLLTAHLIKIVLNYVKHSEGIAFENEFDKFLIVNYIKKLRELDPAESSQFEGICDEATITIRSKFFEEKFAVSVNDIAVEGESELIKSESDHRWTKCKLTNIPLLQLNNRKDELKTFNYIMYRDGGEPEVDIGEILAQLLQTIQYCFITGNKIYAIK
ncbi:predicted protein [Scheffersomyces stipitis CBS 6054]|uniref:Transcription factor IIIC 90kDa subunit N-terminal domain-containing protein n=1 Tax=Scheffersomyces stipitis (strain ATCC 58785 / CBS 6054 / NBRC 10063 / NRRL Y-11545) TaxID=322104 RepID=A3LN12_PICST|nr:predicted protein [Scheffersomyces stipitis CBS 6054]ABN64778.2 predicted protein [Scheffersomyces stipitis CBS 6054]